MKGKHALTALLGACLLAGAALAVDTGRADVSWIQPTTDTTGATLISALTSNTIYRGSKADGSDLVKLATLTPAGASYADKALAFGTYCYAVTASNAAGESPKSAIACKTISEANPSQIIVITVK